VIVGVSAFFPNPLAAVMPRALATGTMRGVHVSAPRRPGLVNHSVLPIALEEAALSPLVQLSIPPGSKTAMKRAHPVVGVSGESWGHSADGRKDDGRLWGGWR
jgi:hypothetical protein